MLAIKPLIALLTVLSTGAAARPRRMVPDPYALGRRQDAPYESTVPPVDPQGWTAPPVQEGAPPPAAPQVAPPVQSQQGAPPPQGQQNPPPTGQGAPPPPVQSAANTAATPGIDPNTGLPIAGGGGGGAGGAGGTGDLTSMPQKPAGMPAKGAASSGKRYVAYWSVTHGESCSLVPLAPDFALAWTRVGSLIVWLLDDR